MPMTVRSGLPVDHGARQGGEGRPGRRRRRRTGSVRRGRVVSAATAPASRRRRRRSGGRRRCSPTRATNRPPGRRLAGVGDDRPVDDERRRVVAGRGRAGAAGDRGDLSQRQGDHRALLAVVAASSLRAARSSSRSSKGWTVPATSWPVSWPLPSDRDGVARPGARRGTRRPPRTARSAPSRRRSDGAPAPRTGAGAGEHRGADRRGVLRAGVVVGDDDDVGARRGGRAHRRPLARVAVAAGTEDDDQPARCVCAAAARPAAAATASAVWAKSTTASGAPCAVARRPAPSGRARAARRDRPDGGVVGRRPLGGEHERRPGGVEPVEVARQRRPQRQPARPGARGEPAAAARGGARRASRRRRRPGEVTRDHRHGRPRPASRRPHSSSTQTTPRRARCGVNSAALAAK